MPHLVSAQNHDWDLTLKAAHMLLADGYQHNLKPKEGTLSQGFAHFTGSMLLSFSAVESITASTAFLMEKDGRFPEFTYDDFSKIRDFRRRLDYLFNAISYKADWSRGMFQHLREMQSWRNLVAHSRPSSMDEKVISNTVLEPKKLFKKHLGKSYLENTDLNDAKMFYETAFEYVELLNELTKIDPRAQVIYKMGD